MVVGDCNEYIKANIMLSLSLLRSSHHISKPVRCFFVCVQPITLYGSKLLLLMVAKILESGMTKVNFIVHVIRLTLKDA